MSDYESFRDEADDIAARQIKDGRWNHEIMEEFYDTTNAETALVEFILSARYGGVIATSELIRQLDYVVDAVEERVADSIEVDLRREAAEAKLDRQLENL